MTSRAWRTRSGRRRPRSSRRCATRSSPTSTSSGPRSPRSWRSTTRAPSPSARGTRRQVFEEQERPLLRPLPAAPYEVCEWVYGRKVQRNCHVSYKRNFYSVSHLAVGRSVDLSVTESTVEVFLVGERLATHPLFPAYARNRYSTHEADLPDGRSYSDWDAGRIRRRAERVGPSCAGVVEPHLHVLRQVFVDTFRIVDSALSARGGPPGPPSLAVLLSEHQSMIHALARALNSMSLPWCMMRSMIAEASLSSPNTTPHFEKLDVGGDDEAAPLVAVAHDLEQEPRALLVERDVAELVDDEEPGSRDVFHEAARADALGSRASGRAPARRR